MVCNTGSVHKHEQMNLQANIAKQGHEIYLELCKNNQESEGLKIMVACPRAYAEIRGRGGAKMSFSKFHGTVTVKTFLWKSFFCCY